MTVLLIFSLDKKLNEDFIITGTINPDMSIGMVSEIYEKANADGNLDAKVFLVPDKQGITFVEESNEKKTGNYLQIMFF